MYVRLHQTKILYCHTEITSTMHSKMHLYKKQGEKRSKKNRIITE